MPSIADLEAAGRRAALQPVPAAPPLAQLQTDAGKKRSQRWLMGASIAAVAVVLAGLPFLLGVQGRSEVQTVSAGSTASQPAASAAQDENVDPEPAQQPAAAIQEDDDADSGEADEDNARIELRFGDDFALSVNVLHGDGAISAAAAAEAAAEETRDVDGVTVWITRDGDQVTASALVDGETFVEIQGPADQLDQVLDVLKDGRFELPELPPFSGHDAEDFFENFGEGFGEGFENFDGEDFSFFFDHEGDFGNFFKEFEGEFGDLFKEFEGEFGQFEQFFDGEFPNFNEFLEGHEFGEHFGTFGEDFEGCISIHGDHNGQDNFTFEFPPGCSAG